MPAKPVFNAQQMEVIHATARKIWKEKFSWMKKRTKEHPPGQEAMALALGITQQSVSSLLKGKYKPGLKVARGIANLDGQTLEDLIGDFEDPDAPKSSAPALLGLASTTFKNLDICIQFYASTKHWSPWTIAAARAGFFGTADFAAPEWATKLDVLERALEKVRRAA
jgi:DNA-binding XRE family transcriptional regulator